jgi:hypothetical protein
MFGHGPQNWRLFCSQPVCYPNLQLAQGLPFAPVAEYLFTDRRNDLLAAS